MVRVRLGYAGQVRRVGSGPFGGGIRLKLAVWGRDRKSRFFHARAGCQVNIPGLCLRAELARLADLCLIAQLPSEPGNRPPFYKAVSDHLDWEYFEPYRRAWPWAARAETGHRSPVDEVHPRMRPAS